MDEKKLDCTKTHEEMKEKTRKEILLFALNDKNNNQTFYYHFICPICQTRLITTMSIKNEWQDGRLEP